MTPDCASFSLMLSGIFSSMEADMMDRIFLCTQALDLFPQVLNFDGFEGLVLTLSITRSSCFTYVPSSFLTVLIVKRILHAE